MHAVDREDSDVLDALKTSLRRGSLVVDQRDVHPISRKTW